MASESDAALRSIVDWLKSYNVPIEFVPFSVYADLSGTPRFLQLEGIVTSSEIGTENKSWAGHWIIEELIALARDVREAAAREAELDLTEDEMAFYDALETNDSAVQVLGDETFSSITRELVETVRTNVTIDWTMRGERAGAACHVSPAPSASTIPVRKAVSMIMQRRGEFVFRRAL